MDVAKMKDGDDKKVTGLGVDLEKKMVLDPEKKMVLDPEKKMVLDPEKKMVLDPNKKMVLDPKKKMVVNRSYDEDLRLFERMCRNFCLEEIEAAGYSLLEDDKTTTTRPAASASAKRCQPKEEEEQQQQEEEIEVVYDFKRPKLPLPPGRPFVRDGDVYIL